MRKINPCWLHTLLLGIGVSIASLSYAHDNHHYEKSQAAAIASDKEKPFGKQGDPKKAVRTIHVDMQDTMRFQPAEIVVRQGDTIHFIASNRGKVMHEMVIGTMEELKSHHAMMQKHPGMRHDEPYMAHVAPAKKESLVWQFTQLGEFYFACLIPGHFEAGMIGKIRVVKG
jgi:uncharacterized cupredoxin-like copper-binding protein